MANSLGYSQSNQNSFSQPWAMPDPNLFSQAIAGMYGRDVGSILKYLQNWTPQLEQMYRQQGAATTQQDFGQMLQILEMENANKANVAQGNLSNYQNYEAPQQILQSQVADSLARQKDPEYFNTRANTANQLNDLMTGRLTGSELSNIERGLNRQFTQQGTFNVPSNIQQLQAATTYGDAGRNRQLQGLGMVDKILPTFRTSEQGPVSTSNRSISDAFAKTDTSGAQGTAKMLFANPVEEAMKSFNTALGIPMSESSSHEKGGGLSA